MLVAAGSMREYFRDALGTALRKSHLRLSDTAQMYLVNLLVEFMRSENVYAGTDAGERPVLADLFSRARDADPQEAVRIYKHMGDSSLYLTGFFTEAVESVGVDYYVSMGGSAYANVAGLMRTTAVTSSALFAELSDRFRELVDLLTAMSLHGEQTQGLDDARALELVERFKRTGDRKILDTLKAHGIVLRPGIDDDSDVN
jgi:aryl carrier-like protein